jgi:hypothetical protein
MNYDRLLCESLEPVNAVLPGPSPSDHTTFRWNRRQIMSPYPSILYQRHHALVMHVMLKIKSRPSPLLGVGSFVQRVVLVVVYIMRSPNAGKGICVVHYS